MYKPKYLYKMKENKQNNINEQFKKNALRSKSFGGKRFLGLTKNGGEVWVSYVLSRDTYDLSISLTHNLSNLLEEGAVLADKRVVLKKGSPQRYSASEMIRKNQKNAGGKVTVDTLRYLERLISAVDSKNGKGYVDGKPTTTLFMMVSNFIYEGGVDYFNKEVRWRDIMEYWDLPKGSYFTIDSFPKVNYEK